VAFRRHRPVYAKKIRNLPLSPRISRGHSCRGPERYSYTTRLLALMWRGRFWTGLRDRLLRVLAHPGRRTGSPLDLCAVCGRGLPGPPRPDHV